jgi:hypothetical protein
MKRHFLRLPSLAAFTLAVAAQAQAASAPPVLSAARFTVEIDGVAVSNITGVKFQSGPSAAGPNGNQAITQLRLTRLLKDVVGGRSDFLKWRQQGFGPDGPVRKDLALLLFDAGFAERGRVLIRGCAVLAWNGPDLSAAGDITAVEESLDLACRGGVQMIGPF